MSDIGGHCVEIEEIVAVVRQLQRVGCTTGSVRLVLINLIDIPRATGLARAIIAVGLGKVQPGARCRRNSNAGTLVESAHNVECLTGEAIRVNASLSPIILNITIVFVHDSTLGHVGAASIVVNNAVVGCARGIIR